MNDDDDWGDDNGDGGGSGDLENGDDDWKDDDEDDKKNKNKKSKASKEEVEEDENAVGDDDDDWGDDSGKAKTKAKTKGKGKSAGGEDESDGGGGGGGGGGADEDDDDDGDGGEWENDAFEESSTNAPTLDKSGEMDADDDSMNPDIMIANIFYEAEDVVRSDPTSALSKFQSVVSFSHDQTFDNLSDESRTAVFQSLVHICVLAYELNQPTLMQNTYTDLLSFIPRVTRNEGAEAIDRVLNAVSSSTDFTLLEQIYSITIERLQSLAETERMLFNVRMKLCKTYVEKGDYKSATRELNTLHNSCRTSDGSDDKKNKGAELLEIYALEIRISSATNDSQKLKSLYESTKDLTAAVKDPRSQSIIRECWGLMFGEEGSWQRAYIEFYSAFTHYQEIGMRDKAKQCLKYVVIANMLAGGEQNPFDAREAKVYQNDSDISAIVGLRSAYEKCDVNAFLKCIDEIHGQSNQLALSATPTPTATTTGTGKDPFIDRHLETMIRDFHCRAILSIVKSYRRIHLHSLARLLRVDNATIERLCVSLILDGLMNGKIDQQAGIVDLSVEKGNRSELKYKAIEQWVGAIRSLTNHVTQPNIPLYS